MVDSNCHFANYSEATQPISISSYRLFPFMEVTFKLFLYAKLQTITPYNSNNVSQDTCRHLDLPLFSLSLPWMLLISKIACTKVKAAYSNSKNKAFWPQASWVKVTSMKRMSKFAGL
jgi:hypothetical protein